ncbi:hypothetical protein K0M31_002956, partial [Melipona bicolor]
MSERVNNSTSLECQWVGRTARSPRISTLSSHLSVCCCPDESGQKNRRVFPMEREMECNGGVGRKQKQKQKRREEGRKGEYLFEGNQLKNREFCSGIQLTLNELTSIDPKFNYNMQRFFLFWTLEGPTEKAR